MGSMICEAKGAPDALAMIEYGAFFGDPTIALATAYSASKNRTGIRDASLITLGFHCQYKSKKMKEGGLISYALSRRKRNEVEELVQITNHIGPQVSEVQGRVDFDKFLGDSAEYLRHN